MAFTTNRTTTGKTVTLKKDIHKKSGTGGVFQGLSQGEGSRKKIQSAKKISIKEGSVYADGEFVGWKGTDKGFYGHMDPSKIKRQKIRGGQDV